jgi:hypothetical protein
MKGWRGLFVILTPPLAREESQGQMLRFAQHDKHVPQLQKIPSNNLKNQVWLISLNR